MKSINNVLVVLLKDKSDFLIAQEQSWYRIPIESRLPLNLRDETAEFIAFYFPKKFEDLKYSIRYYAKISAITQVKRSLLFPEEAFNTKSNNIYLKISFEKLIELPKPIISHRGRLLLFIPTTWEKFIHADEINDLFNESHLEDKLWSELKKRNLPAERQYFLQTNEKNWVCDFAFFCKKGTIDVECDGDEHHMQYESVIYDKVRNNEIESVANWDVLRFTTLHIEKQMDWTLQTIMRKIDRLGGLYYTKDNTYRYVSPSDNQLNLF